MRQRHEAAGYPRLYRWDGTANYAGPREIGRCDHRHPPAHGFGQDRATGWRKVLPRGFYAMLQILLSAWQPPSAETAYVVIRSFQPGYLGKTYPIVLDSARPERWRGEVSGGRPESRPPRRPRSAGNPVHWLRSPVHRAPGSMPAGRKPVRPGCRARW